MLVTADPILVALSYEAWWRRNGEPPVPQGEPLPIPLFAEAVEIVRSRRILNWKGPKNGSVVPALDRLPKNPRRRARRGGEQSPLPAHRKNETPTQEQAFYLLTTVV